METISYNSVHYGCGSVCIKKFRRKFAVDCIFYQSVISIFLIDLSLNIFPWGNRIVKSKRRNRSQILKTEQKK